jgi:DNA-binding transcriptional ArsR family regulator
MDTITAAKAMKELGHPTRLSIFKRLVRAGEDGLPVGVIQEELEVPGSTLSHHLSSLASAGLLSQHRDGRTLYCIPNYERLQSVIDFLQEECCADKAG